MISDTTAEEVAAMGRQSIRCFWRKDRIQDKSLQLSRFSLQLAPSKGPDTDQRRSLQGFFVWGDFVWLFNPAASHDCRHRPLKALFLVIMVFLPVGLSNKRNRR